TTTRALPSAPRPTAPTTSSPLPSAAATAPLRCAFEPRTEARSPVMARQSSTNSPALPGDYDIVRPLGEGGMGKVFLARHRPTGNEVVVKQVHEKLATDPSVRQSLAREVQVLRRFRHRHAVALLDAVLEGASPHLVMEYVPGISLE